MVRTLLALRPCTMTVRPSSRAPDTSTLLTEAVPPSAQRVPDAVLPDTSMWLPGVALAQGYPERPIKFVIPYAAGGATDILGRLLASGLSEKLGQPVVVENRPGAGTVMAAGQVAKAAPDGYTLLAGASTTLTLNPANSQQPAL